jgi:hypothetical protein
MRPIKDDHEAHLRALQLYLEKYVECSETWTLDRYGNWHKYYVFNRGMYPLSLNESHTQS